MGNYTIEPVEPLDYNPSFYQPMRETVTNRCHNILKSIWPRTTYACDTLKTISVLQLMVIYYVARQHRKNQTQILDNLKTPKSD